MLSQSINSSLTICDFCLVAFVYMPEHIHLLIYPAGPQRADISRFLKAIKRPFSFRVKQELQRDNSRLLDELNIADRAGKKRFRFWQSGPGYDRNLSVPSTVLASIDYIHRNPVARGLCERAIDWKWSSSRYYNSETYTSDDDLPIIHGLPSSFLD